MKVHCYSLRPPCGFNMADQNTTVSPETIGEIVADFGEICRFCLSETKSDVSINDKCMWEESTESEEESIYNFMTRLNFIKMNNSDSFPLQVCENCFKLVQLCHDFGQLCQKSDNLLKTFYENSLKETETKIKISVKEPYCQELLDYDDEELPKTTNNFSAALDEINKIKRTCSGQKLANSVTVLKAYKQKLILLSDRIKKSQSKHSNSTSGEELITELTKGQCVHSCSQCSLKFGSSKDLNLHYAVTHSQKRFRNVCKFQCKNCLKSFSCEEKLRRHYRVIHKISELPDDYLNKVKQPIQADNKKFFCFHCTSYTEFQSQDHLTEHLNAFHNNDPSKISDFYSCAHCNYSNFPSRLNLNQHLLLVHKLGEDKIAKNDMSTAQDPKPPKVFLCVNPKSPSHYEKQSQNITELSAFLGALDSVVDSLNVIQGETGFKVLCKNCEPQPEFTSPNEFVSHIQTHHWEPKVFENRGINEKTAKKDGPWICSECPASYSRKQSLFYHLKEKHKHTNMGGMKCPDCPERFATNRQLIQHGINTHQKYFAYFHNVYKKILQPENEEEEENKVKNFECDMCQKRYIYKTSLKKHILVAHLGQTPSHSVVCSYCGKTLSNKLNLKSHIEFVHEALFVSCPICKKRINFRTIGKHYKTHKNSDVVHSNSLLCNLCGKVLKSKRSFEDHQKLHKNIRDELCDVCGSGFTTKKCLRLHKKTHEGVQRKVFGCDQCDKVFSGRHTLNRHLLTHSGKKNFICEICSKCFYTLQELNRHVRYHRKEYRFECQLCDMKFLDKSRFRHHMMRHRNVRPHKCQFCDKMFIVKGKMNVHMAAKHNIELQNTKGVWKDPKTYVPLDDLL